MVWAKKCVREVLGVQWVILQMTNECRRGATGIICAEYTSSMSVGLREKSPQGVCAGCPETDSERQILSGRQKLTGDMWWEVMDRARYDVITQSVCTVDCLSSTLGRSHCPVRQRLRKEVDSYKDNTSAWCFSELPLLPLHFSLWFMCIIHYVWLILSRIKHVQIISINHLCSHLFLFLLFISLSIYLSSFSSRLFTIYPFVLCGQRKRKKKHLALQSKNNKTITGKGPCKLAWLHMWFKDEETMYEIFFIYYFFFFFRGN